MRALKSVLTKQDYCTKTVLDEKNALPKSRAFLCIGLLFYVQSQIILSDLDSFNYRIESVKSIVNAISLLYKGKITVDTQISYHNMAEANKNNPEATEAIFASGKKLGLSFEEAIIRGGTDGARLAETGIACPNLFTGGHNLHSLTEWVSVESMNHSANLVLGIIDFWTGR